MFHALIETDPNAFFCNSVCSSLVGPFAVCCLLLFFLHLFASLCCFANRFLCASFELLHFTCSNQLAIFRIGITNQPAAHTPSDSSNKTNAEQKGRARKEVAAKSFYGILTVLQLEAAERVYNCQVFANCGVLGLFAYDNSAE